MTCSQSRMLETPLLGLCNWVVCVFVAHSCIDSLAHGGGKDDFEREDGSQREGGAYSLRNPVQWECSRFELLRGERRQQGQGGDVPRPC